MTQQSFVARGLLGSALMLCWACSSSTTDPEGHQFGAGGSTGGNAGSTGGTQDVTGGSAGNGAAGAGGVVGGGSGGTAEAGAGGTSEAGAGGASDGGASGASGGAGAAGGPVVLAGCDQNDYDLCIDFESGIDTATWQGGTQNAIVTTDFAHGAHSYRLYPMSGGKLTATSLGAITNQIWGRFYVHFKPGAPGGHGNIVAAFDQSNNWYEMGWQFDAMMGVWHASSGAERPLRSTPFIVDQWYCVELFFDGTKTEMPQWWLDGEEVDYYMAANEGLTPQIVTAFERIEVGFTPYAGLGLQMPDGLGPPDNRVLTDMWIDDIAFDAERIGCISE